MRLIVKDAIKPKRHFLTQQEKHFLNVAVMNVKSEVKAMTLSEVVEFLTSIKVQNNFDFPFNIHHVKAALAITQTEFRKRKIGKTPKAANATKTLHCAQIKTLAIAIKELYTDMGCTIHPGVLEIIESFSGRK